VVITRGAGALARERGERSGRSLTGRREENMNAKKVFRSVMVLTLTAALAAISLSLFAQATPPARINYQGVLRDASGKPVADGNYDMTFLFYDAATGGTLLLTDSHLASGSGAVPVSGGLFTVALGSGTLTAGSESTLPAVFANHAAVYLAVKVGSDAEMTPRIQVVSAPFAENCDTLDGKHATDFIAASSSGNFLNTSSTAQTKAEKLTLNGATDYGIVASGPTAGGYFKDSNNSGLAYLGIWDYGIDARGNYAGGFFMDLNQSGKAYVGYGDVGIDAYGSDKGGYFHGPGTGYAYAAYGDDGIYARGSNAGGFFMDLNGYGWAYVGKSEVGIEAYGTGAGGYFHGQDSGKAYVGYGNDGIDAYGSNAGGYFHGPNSGYAYAGKGNIGIEGYGSDKGGYFHGPESGKAYVGYGDVGIDAYGSTGGYFHGPYSGFAQVSYGDIGVLGVGDFAGGSFWDGVSLATYVGYSTYKIYGNGTVSFVQNHPTEKDKVIVYACPEGDEVATYTRGTAKLVNGEAHVKLGDTFKWVTNPDIGLTAHLTPKGDCNGLYAESVSTTEMVVKELNGGKSNVAFDYIVYGLRIGFEESSIVQEKQQEFYIPSFKDHRERYAKFPELRAFNALERFKTMESSVRGVEPASIDLSRAKALHDAIHEYDPATDPPADKLFGHDHGAKPDDAGNASNPSPAVSPKPERPALQPVLASYDNPAAGSAEPAGGVVEVKPALPCFASTESVEAGDVITMDPSSKGYIRRCTVMADPLVVGIAAGPGGNCAADSRAEEVSASNRVPVSTSGIVSCKVDATYGAIREGDLLVASPTPGHAMRAENPAQGTVIGKALEPLPNGTGLIKVLVMLR